MYQHRHFWHVTNEYLLLKKCIFHDFGILDLRTTEPFRSDSRTLFSNLRIFGLNNLRTHEPSNLRTFGLLGCNRHTAVNTPHMCHTAVKTPHNCHTAVKTPHKCHTAVKTPHMCHTAVKTPHNCHTAVKTPHMCHTAVKTPHTCHTAAKTSHMCHTAVNTPHMCHTAVKTPHNCHTAVKTPHMCHTAAKTSHMCHTAAKTPPKCYTAAKTSYKRHIVKKLFFYGIRGTANAWLNNYLTNRNQYVIADDHSSGMRLITCGVPQGSVLGPVLFLLYINDICNVSNLLKFVLFADDTNIFCSSTSLHDLQVTINRELDKLFVWFSVNRLSLNLGKTNYMLFRSRPPDNELALKINNVVLPRVAATKFLGIIIDDKLSWKPHIQSVKSKLSSVLSIMYKASKLINTTGMYTLYCSLFHPYLSYCNEIWGNTYTSNVKCLFTLQKKAIRLICNADRLAHTNAMFKDMSILKLSEFVKYKTAIVMFNIFHGTLPIQLQMRFTKYSSVYSTRQTKSFVMVQVRTNLKAMCLSVHGVKLWNTLPDDIKNCTSVNIFKKCIKKHFLSHY